MLNKPLITISGTEENDLDFPPLYGGESLQPEVDETSCFTNPLLSQAAGSCQVSTWDVATKGRRDENIAFYVGSTYTLTSAESLPFFNTLYANGYVNICRICHQPAGNGKDGKEPLSSPCSCTGPLKFVHHSCLVKWLDVQTRHLGKPPFFAFSLIQ